MSVGHFRLTSLHFRLALMRLGWPYGLTALVGAAGAASWLWAVPHLLAQTDLQQKALAPATLLLQSNEQTASAVQPSTAELRITSFYEALGEKDYAEQQVKTLFAVAAKTGIALNQAEYKFTFHKEGRYYTYQINLPVKGSYDAIRQFCKQVLLAIPFASLDEINFKREAISNPTLEARVRITLYLAVPSHQTANAIPEREDVR